MRTLVAALQCSEEAETNGGKYQSEWQRIKFWRGAAKGLGFSAGQERVRFQRRTGKA